MSVILGILVVDLVEYQHSKSLSDKVCIAIITVDVDIKTNITSVQYSLSTATSLFNNRTLFFVQQFCHTMIECCI